MPVQSNRLICGNGFTRRFLVLPVKIGRKRDTAGPRVSLIPVLVTKQGECRILYRWIGNISNEHDHLFKEFSTPLRVKVRDNRRSVNVIPVVKMMIIVKSYRQAPTNRVRQVANFKRNQKLALYREERVPFPKLSP